MAIKDLFEVTSKEEREERSRNFERKIFPFGDRQRKWATSMLNDNIKSKISDNEKLYHFINIKSIKLEESAISKEKALDKWCKGFLKKTLADSDVAFLFAMAELDITSSKEDEFPDLASILALAREYETSLLPDLKQRVKKKYIFF